MGLYPHELECVNQWFGRRPLRRPCLPSLGTFVAGPGGVLSCECDYFVKGKVFAVVLTLRSDTLDYSSGSRAVDYNRMFASDDRRFVGYGKR